MLKINTKYRIYQLHKPYYSFQLYPMVETFKTEEEALAYLINHAEHFEKDVEFTILPIIKIEWKRN